MDARLVCYGFVCCVSLSIYNFIYNYIQIYKCGDGSLLNCINACNDKTLAMSYVTQSENICQKKFLCYNCMIRLMCNVNCYTDNS